MITHDCPLKAFGLQPIHLSSNEKRMNQKTTGLLIIRYVTIIILILWSTTCLMVPSQAKKPSNRLTIKNDSGQFASVKIVGPTRAVMKVPLEQKKSPAYLWRVLYSREVWIRTQRIYLH